MVDLGRQVRRKQEVDLPSTTQNTFFSAMAKLA